MKAYIVWNEGKNEGVVFANADSSQDDALECANRNFGNPRSSLGEYFSKDCYDDEKLLFEEVELPEATVAIWGEAPDTEEPNFE